MDLSDEGTVNSITSIIDKSASSTLSPVQSIQSSDHRKLANQRSPRSLRKSKFSSHRDDLLNILLGKKSKSKDIKVENLGAKAGKTTTSKDMDSATSSSFLQYLRQSTVQATECSRTQTLAIRPCLKTERHNELNSSQELDSDQSHSMRHFMGHRYISPLSSDEKLDCQRSLSEGLLVDSGCNRDGLSQSHDSVFSDSVTASSLSIVLKTELADVLRKRRNQQNASEEDLGLPQSPSLFKTSSVSQEEQMRVSTASLSNANTTDLDRSEASNQQEEVDCAISSFKHRLLTHSAAKHKMAIRPAKKKAPSRHHRSIVQVPIREVNENSDLTSSRTCYGMSADFSDLEIKHKTQSLPPGLSNSSLGQHEQATCGGLNFVKKVETTKEFALSSAEHIDSSISGGIGIRLLSLNSSYSFDHNESNTDDDIVSDMLTISAEEFENPTNTVRSTQRPPLKVTERLASTASTANIDAKEAYTSRKTELKSGAAARQRVMPLDISSPNHTLEKLSSSRHNFHVEMEDYFEGLVPGTQPIPNDTLQSTSLVQNVVATNFRKSLDTKSYEPNSLQHKELSRSVDTFTVNSHKLPLGMRKGQNQPTFIEKSRSFRNFIDESDRPAIDGTFSKAYRNIPSLPNLYSSAPYNTNPAIEKYVPFSERKKQPTSVENMKIHHAVPQICKVDAYPCTSADKSKSQECINSLNTILRSPGPDSLGANMFKSPRENQSCNDERRLSGVDAASRASSIRCNAGVVNTTESKVTKVPEFLKIRLNPVETEGGKRISQVLLDPSKKPESGSLSLGSPDKRNACSSSTESIEIFEHNTTAGESNANANANATEFGKFAAITAKRKSSLTSNTTATNSITLNRNDAIACNAAGKLFLEQSKQRSFSPAEVRDTESNSSHIIGIIKDNNQHKKELSNTLEAPRNSIVLRKMSLGSQKHVNPYITKDNNNTSESTPELMKAFARFSLKIKDEDTAVCDRINHLCLTNATKPISNDLTALGSSKQQQNQISIDSDKENQTASNERLDKALKLEGTESTARSAAGTNLRYSSGADATEPVTRSVSNIYSNNNNNVGCGDVHKSPVVPCVVTKAQNYSLFPPHKIGDPPQYGSANNYNMNNNNNNGCSYTIYGRNKTSSKNVLENNMEIPLEWATKCVERSATVSEFKGIHQRRAEWEQRAKEALK